LLISDSGRKGNVALIISFGLRTGYLVYCSHLNCCSATQTIIVNVFRLDNLHLTVFVFILGLYETATSMKFEKAVE